MAKNNNLTDFVTDLADAIRAKCKTTGTINPQDFSAFVGGMPFFKFLRTEDITTTADSGTELPLSYNQVYIKGEVYLTNDNGLTTTGEDSYGMVIANGFDSQPLFTINNTTDRMTLSGYTNSMMANFIGFLRPAPSPPSRRYSFSTRRPLRLTISRRKRCRMLLTGLNAQG